MKIQWQQNKKYISSADKSKSTRRGRACHMITKKWFHWISVRDERIETWSWWKIWTLPEEIGSSWCLISGSSRFSCQSSVLHHELNHFEATNSLNKSVLLVSLQQPLHFCWTVYSYFIAHCIAAPCFLEVYIFLNKIEHFWQRFGDFIFLYYWCFMSHWMPVNASLETQRHTTHSAIESVLLNDKNSIKKRRRSWQT